MTEIKSPGIDKYLLSTCLFVIDDFNEKYQNSSRERMREDADNCYSEADLVIRLGFPFRQMATFTMQGTNGNDIFVKSKDFRVEVKYLKTYKGESGNRSVRTPWDHIEKDFNWLKEEIKNGSQYKRACVMGWFNFSERFSELMQLGSNDKKGALRTIDNNKIVYFPFINFNPVTRDTKTVSYRYDLAYEVIPLSIPGFVSKMYCMFLGSPDDRFHIAMYY